jgi:hypothetical protein
MKYVPLPYHFSRPLRRLQIAMLDNIAIVLASLLAHKAKYIAVARCLPIGSVFICTPTLSKQRKIIEHVASYFHLSGHQVTTLPIDDLLHNRIEVTMQPQFGTFKQAQRVQRSEPQQIELRLAT